MKDKHAIIILVIVYLVGIIGFLLPIHEDFALLTPVNLLVSMLLVILSQAHRTTKIYLFLSLCFFVGLSAEIFGVNTGLLFGEYNYGPVLGYQIMGTPIMIGVNWAMLSFCAGATINSFFENKNWILKSFLGASAMVLLDFIIEPVAIHYDFWSWENNIIPIKNYVAWFSIALGLLLVFNKFLGTLVNKVAIVLFILQFVFFGILRLTL